ncbi:hypothetical protein LCGC14_0549350 [marine sediment metagenome]|uniref:Uncharacterized protein n=1 Tax=marine sediment metagenome TaxID=412755 RepID=A0A0F9RV53_9ZZZZ
MSVVYTRSDSVGRKIVPAPLITVNKNYETNGEGTRKGSSYSITLTGSFIPFKGSPSGSYSSLSQAFWTIGGYPPDETYEANNEDFNHILRKQEALRWLFSEDGGILEWQPAGGQPPVKCYPRVLSINFPEGQWADRCDYTIELEAPWIYINGTTDIEDSFATDLISSSSETWSFEEIVGHESEQYKVTHEVNADGKLGYDGAGSLYGGKQAWEHAKDFVDTRVSGAVDSNIMFAALGASDKITGHYNNVIRIDQDGGTYGVTEEWLLSDSNTYEERQFTVDYNQSQDEYSVTYQGTINGVASGSLAGNASNMNQAKAAIPSIITARTTTISYVGSLLGGRTIPNSPDKQTFALNQIDGIVTFTYQWNTSDNTTVFIIDEAQHSYSLDNLLNTLTFTQTAEGKGSTSTERLANAKSAVYTNSEALALAKTLAGTSLSYNLTSVVKAFGERDGTVRTTWTWTDRDSHGKEVTIQSQEPTAILAVIPIPGRAAGPIIQNMGTQSSEVITVSIRSKRNLTQPTLATEPYGEGGTIISDSSTWNPQTGVADRTTRFRKET